MSVMPFNHADAGAHLYRQRMYIHTVVKQRKGRIGVAQAVERSVLARSWAGDQPHLRQERPERLMEIIGHGAVRQAKHRQIQPLLEHLFKGDVLDVFTVRVDTLEEVYRAASTDDVAPSGFALHAHLKILQPALFKQRHMLPAQVLGFCAMPHAGVGQYQHIVAHEMPHVSGFARFALINPARQPADQATVFLAGEIWAALAFFASVDQQGHILVRQEPTCHSLFEHTVHG